MRYHIHFFVLLLFQLSLLSQTYVGPGIAVDFTKMESTDLDPSTTIFQIINKGYSIKSMAYGLQVEQTVSKYFFVSYNFNYSRKNVDAYFYGFIPFEGFQYDYFRNFMALKYKPNKFLFIGIGGNFNFITNKKYVIQDQAKGEFVADLKDYGIHFSTGIKYKGFNLELYYCKGLKTNENREMNFTLKPIHSFGVSLIYLIKVFGKHEEKTGT